MYYNDSDYDGVVLKIDTGFIMTNPEIKQSLQNLLADLKECKFSTMIPSHQKNINELTDYDSKIKQVRQRRKEDEEWSRNQKSKRDERNKRMLNHEEFEIEYISTTVCSIGYSDFILINGKKFSDWSTKRGYIKAEVKNCFKEFSQTLTNKDFEELIKLNFGWFDEVRQLTPLMNPKTVSLILNKHGNAEIRIKLPYLHVVTKESKRGLKFIRVPLAYDYDKQQYFSQFSSEYLKKVNYDKNGYKMQVVYLEDYKIINNKLKKVSNESKND